MLVNKITRILKLGRGRFLAIQNADSESNVQYVIVCITCLAKALNRSCSRYIRVESSKGGIEFKDELYAMPRKVDFFTK